MAGRMIWMVCLGIAMALSLTACRNNALRQAPQQLEDGRYLLPNGWILSPAGREMELGGLPLKMTPMPDGRHMLVMSNGYTDHFIAVVDVEAEEEVSRRVIDAGWLGVDVSQDGRHVYASAGTNDLIYVFEFDEGELEPSADITLPEGTYPMGLTLSRSGDRLYVVGNHNDTFLTVDVESGQLVSTVAVGTTPYTTTVTADERLAYVSNWGERSVAVVDIPGGQVVRNIAVQDHPNDLILTEDERFLFVASGNWNIVSVIDTEQGRVIEEIDVALVPGAPLGSTPNALALSLDQTTLYVANADNNALAVIDVSSPGASEPQGFIPTGWYPTAVAFTGDGQKLLVANGKGSVSRPSGSEERDLPGGSIHEVLEGTLSFIDVPDEQQLADYSRQVHQNAPYSRQAAHAKAPFALGDDSPIEYVFYIIKENRTYDQIFGGMEIGNGDPDYSFFPEEVTPNHHALARQFVLFDNFYHDAEVSMDGHHWSTSAYATDYVEKFWPAAYGRKGLPRLGVHDDSIAYSSGGFIWDLCAEFDISYRSYGEFARVWIPRDGEDEPDFETLRLQDFSWNAEEDLARGMQIRAATPSLEGHFHPNYAGSDYIQGMSDLERFDIWLEEFRQFEEEGEMPRFTVLSLPGDHLLGTRPGVQTPRAMMAENDLVLGQMVEVLSNSPFWEKLAIFVIEDDPQAGPDHVDAHRTVALVISPYMKRGIVDSTMYSSSGMLRTMEEILGLPPMTQYDASATPMWAAFQAEPDLTPYMALPAQVPLDEFNVASDYGAQESMQLTLDVADTAPDDEYNRILWKAIKGAESEVPPRRRAAFVLAREDE